MDAAAFRTMYQHNAWANRLVLARAASVREQDYGAGVPGISFGSLHATLLHILDSEWNWFSRLRGEPHTVWEPDLEAADFAELRQLWEREIAVQEAYVASLTDSDVSADASYTFGSGETMTMPRWQVLYHLLTHSLQYRGEAAVRLTQLGASPGDLDFKYFLSAQKDAGSH
jgi:uncharacterized damage-inducible protein DinB